MPNKQAVKWAAELLSGEYEQGQKVLRTKDNEFCCIGVACDIYAKETGMGGWSSVPTTANVGTDDEDNEILGYTFFVEGEQQQLGFPDVVAEYFGINTDTGKGAGYREKPKSGAHGYESNSSLATQNDAGKSFADIAGIILSEPKGLYVDPEAKADVPPQPKWSQSAQPKYKWSTSQQKYVIVS